MQHSVPECVVAIWRDADQKHCYLGSGTLVARRYVITCWHVVQSSSRARVSVDGVTIGATRVTAEEGQWDLALLELDHEVTIAGAVVLTELLWAHLARFELLETRLWGIPHLRHKAPTAGVETKRCDTPAQSLRADTEATVVQRISCLGYGMPKGASGGAMLVGLNDGRFGLLGVIILAGEGKSQTSMLSSNIISEFLEACPLKDFPSRMAATEALGLNYDSSAAHTGAAHTGPLLVVGHGSDWANGSATVPLFGNEEQTRVADWAHAFERGTLRFLVLHGVGGSGKSTTALSLWCALYRDARPSPYEYAAWISLSDEGKELTVEKVVQRMAEALSLKIEPGADAADALTAKLNGKRTLIILDNLETAMRAAPSGDAGHDFGAYEDFIFRLRSTSSVSLIVTSRMLPPFIQARRYQANLLIYPLQGVSPEAAHAILEGELQKKRPLLDTRTCDALDAARREDWDAVIEHVSRNPLMLELTVGAILRDPEAPGNPKACLHRLPEDVKKLLAWHWNVLTPLEREVMLWLAINRSPVTFDELKSDIASTKAQDELHQTILHLELSLPLRRLPTGFVVHGNILDFSTKHVIDDGTQQISALQDERIGLSDETVRDLNQLIVRASVENLEMLEEAANAAEISKFQADVARDIERKGCTSIILIDHALLKVSASCEVQALQRHEILRPFLRDLRQPKSLVRRRLVRLIQMTRGTPGYLTGNLLNLLRELDGGAIESAISAEGADIRQVDLRGLITRAPLNLRQARLSRVALTQWLGQPRAVRSSPDGRSIAVGDNVGSVTIWRVTDMSSPVRRHTNHGSSTIRALAFSRDGALLASAGEDHAVFVWDSWMRDEGVPWSLFDDPSRGVEKRQKQTLRDIAFSARGHLATASEDGTIYVYDIKRRESTKWLELPDKGDGRGGTVRAKVHAIAFHPRSDAMLVGTSDGTVLWLDPDKPGLPRSVLRPGSQPAHAKAVWSVSFEASGDHFVTAAADGCVRVWRSADSSLCWEGTMQDEGFTAAFSADGKIVVSGGEDAAVYFWDSATERSAGRYVHSAEGEGHEERVRSIAACEGPRGTVFVSGGFDRKLLVWGSSGERIENVAGYGNGVTGLAFGPNGDLVGSYEDRCIRRWELRGPAAARESLVLVHDAPALCVTVRQSDGAIFSGGRDRAIRTRELSGEEAHELGHHEHWVASVDLNHDGTRLATGSEDATIQLWDLVNGRKTPCQLGESAQPSVLPAHAHEDRVRVVRFSPNAGSPLLVSGGYDNTVRVWNAQTGALLREIRGAAVWVVGLDVSYDGLLACSWGRGSVGLFDLNALLADGKAPDAPLASWQVDRSNGARVFCVRFVAENRLITASEDGEVSVWTAETGDWRQRDRWRFRGHDLGKKAPKITALAVRSDGLIASGDSLGRTLLWRPGTEAPEGDVLSPRLPYAGLDLTDATRVTDAATGRGERFDAGEREALRHLGATV